MQDNEPVAFALYNPGLTRLEFYTKETIDKETGETLIAAFPYGSKKEEIEKFIHTLLDEHGLEIENLVSILGDDRYDEQFT